MEGIAGEDLIEGHDAIRHFRVMFDQLRVMAPSPRDSTTLIPEVAAALGK